MQRPACSRGETAGSWEQLAASLLALSVPEAPREKKKKRRKMMSDNYVCVCVPKNMYDLTRTHAYFQRDQSDLCLCALSD